MIFSIERRSAARLRKALGPARWARALEAAANEALGWYARAREGLLDRVGPGKIGRYNLTARSGGYQERQERAFGQTAAYLSPRRRNHARALLAVARLAAGGATLAGTAIAIGNAARAHRPHLRDLVRQPGIGHRTKARAGKSAVRAVLTLPGARILNRGGGSGFAKAKFQSYRKELTDLDRGPARGRLLARFRATLFRLIGATP